MTAGKELAAKNKQVMAIAYSPFKNILTTGFMLWMSGSSIQIFSIMMTGMALYTPLAAISSVNKTFAKFQGEVDVNIPKLIFLSLQLLALGIALYKCSTMGLLPVTAADWTSLVPHKHAIEQAALSI